MMARMMAVCVCLLMIAVTARAQNPALKVIKKQLAKLNEAFEKGDEAAIKGLTTKDHLSVTPYYNGAFDLTQQLKTLEQLKLTKYEAGKKSFKMLDKNTVLITYRLSQEGTFQGQKIAPFSFVSAIWIKRENKWMEAFYQETLIKK